MDERREGAISRGSRGALSSYSTVKTMMSQGNGPNLSLLSRPATRSVVIQQWLTAMRDRGVIISDAQMRYRRWLAMSETDRQLSPNDNGGKRTEHHYTHTNTSSNGSDKPRPYTAPATVGTYIVEHTKTSRLRLEKLQEPKAEADYNALAKQKRQFNRLCHTISATPVMTENCAGDDVTMYEFLIGSRYNCARHIDSRSLYRLGVYVPREDVNSAFINPGGILPPAEYARRSRRRSFLTKGKKNRDSFHSFDHEGYPSHLTIGSSLASQTLPSFDENQHTPSIQSLDDFVTKSDGDIIKKTKGSRHTVGLKKSIQHRVASSPQINNKKIISIDMQNMLLQKPYQSKDNDSLRGSAREYVDSLLDDSNSLSINNDDNNLETTIGKEDELKEEDPEEEMKYYQEISEKFGSVEAMKDIETQTIENETKQQNDDEIKDKEKEQSDDSQEEKREDLITPVTNTNSTTLVIDMSNLDNYSNSN